MCFEVVGFSIFYGSFIFHSIDKEFLNIGYPVRAFTMGELLSVLEMSAITALLWSHDFASSSSCQFPRECKSNGEILHNYCSDMRGGASNRPGWSHHDV